MVLYKVILIDILTVLLINAFIYGIMYDTQFITKQ